MQQKLIVKVAVLVLLGSATVFAAPDLGYQDEARVKRFDYQYKGAVQDLERATDDSFHNASFISKIERACEYAQKALDEVTVQTHPDVTSRRTQLAQLRTSFAERRARAEAGLSPNDVQAIAQFDQLRERLLKELGEDPDETILRGDPSAPTTIFDATLAQMRTHLDGVRLQQHADLLAARERLAAAEAAFAQRRDDCLARLRALGDVVALTDEHVGWIMQHHHINPDHNRILPRVPEERTVDSMTAFAHELKAAVGVLKNRIEFLQALPKWDPRWTDDRALSNRVNRALGLAQGAVARPDAFVDNLMKTSDLDPEAVEVRDLREAAGGGGSKVWGLQEAVAINEALGAFCKAYSGRPNAKVEKALVDVQRRLTRLGERITAQLDSERLPAAGPAQETHLRIAREFFPKALVIHLTTLERKKGVETTRTETGRTDAGNNQDRVTYRVDKYPYDYELLSGYAVFKDDEGQFVVHLIECKYHHIRYGDAPVSQWFANGSYFQHLIREEHVPPMPDLPSAAARPTPESPAPTSSESPAATPVAVTPEATTVAVDAPTDAPAPEEPSSGGGSWLGLVLGGACCLFVFFAAAGGGLVMYLRSTKAPAPPAP